MKPFFMSVRVLWYLICLSGLFAANLAPAQTLHFATEEFAPFNWAGKQHPEGPMVEVVQAVCRTANFTCLIKVFPWRRAQALAEEGQIDGLFAMVATPEREKKFWFTHAVVRTNLKFFVAANSSWQYHTLDDLNGMTLVAYGPSGSSSKLTEMVAKNRNARMEIELNHVNAFRKLASGRYGANAAVLANHDGVRKVLQRDGLQGIKVAGQVMTVDFAIGLSRKKVDPALFEKFNATLQQLQQSGVVGAIIQKHRLQQP